MAFASLLVISALASASAGLAVAGHPDAPAVLPPLARRAPSAPINLSVAAAFHAPAISASDVRLPAWAPNADRWDERGSRTSINFGPFHTEFGGVTGRHMHLATVRLEGVSVLGGAIGGSLDSRSARITFSWPTGN